MLEIYERKAGENDEPVNDRVVLPYDVRVKGRFKTNSVGGREIRVFLDRGKTLQIGEILVSSCGENIEVLGAEEDLVAASSDDPAIFARACYHMGNRHMTLQVDDGEMRFKSDYVLEDMLRQQGLSVRNVCEVFTPESGAYGHHKH